MPSILKRLDDPRVYFGLAALLLVIAIFSQLRIRLPARPSGGVEELHGLAGRDDLNVVFILIDTLRADRLHCYGYERQTSPVIDWLAETGVRFARVQSQSSWTKASMASLWTGMYPTRIGVTRFHDGLPDQATTAAEVLQRAGLFTAGLYRNGWVDTNFGFHQGFDLYVRPIPNQTPEHMQRRSPSAANPLMGTDADVSESALEFIRAQGERRFFLYLHYMDLHQYVTDQEFAVFGSEYSDAYDNAILWTDRNVSAVVAGLEESGLLDRTLIVLASDHGEAFREHGLEGHARNLYREVTETPLILSLPFRLPSGVVVESTVENVDVWPTVLDLLGLGPLPDADGRSLLPLIEAAIAGRPEAEFLEPRAALAELDLAWGKSDATFPTVAIVEGDHRLIHQVKRPEKPELYDHRSDPSEQVNVADENPELVARLREQAEAHLERGSAFEVPQVEIDEMRKGQLRALGYVDVE